MRVLVTFVLVVAAAAVGCDRSVSSSSAVGPGDRAASVRNPAAPDNTAINKRDVDTNTSTPIDQKENKADLDLTAKIRQRVVDVKDLSVNARNAKIISVDGK